MSKQCKCEHWQQCPVCKPHRFYGDGNLLPPEPTPLQEARQEAQQLRDQLAASRDAEIVSLTNQRDYEYVRAENAEQERAQFEQESDQLRKQVKMLRDVVGHVAGMRFSIVTTKMCEAALAATEPNK